MDPVEAPADPGRPSGAVTHDAASRLRRWGPYGLAPVLVLVAASFIDGMESNFIPGVLSLLQKEFHFGDTAAGAIPAAMAIAGLIVTLPAGYLADRTNRKRLLAIVVASWSVFTLASGLATTFVMFFVIRVILGAAANIDNPLSASLVTDFYPASSRARVFAFIRAGGYVGLALGIAIGGALGQAFGWRAPFFFMKDAIRRRGENVSSFEVESFVNQHPKVAESAAVAVPAEISEDEIKICVVVRVGESLEPAELIEFLTPRMPRFMIPRYVELVDALPKTQGTLRTRKVELRDSVLNRNTWDREAK